MSFKGMGGLREAVFFDLFCCFDSSLWLLLWGLVFFMNSIVEELSSQLSSLLLFFLFVGARFSLIFDFISIKFI